MQRCDLQCVMINTEECERRLVQYGVFLEMVWYRTLETLGFEPLLREQSTLVSVRTITEDGRDCVACDDKMFNELETNFIVRVI